MNLFRFKLDDDFFPGISANAAIPGYWLSNPFGIANTQPYNARESEASDHKVVRHKCVRMTEIDDENENNFGYLKFISNFADADRIPQRPGRGLT